MGELQFGHGVQASLKGLRCRFCIGSSGLLHEDKGDRSGEKDQAGAGIRPFESLSVGGRERVEIELSQANVSSPRSTAVCRDSRCCCIRRS